MRAYTVQRQPSYGAPVVLPERFSWWALIFGPLWLLWNGLWLSALGLFALEIGVQAGIEHLRLGPVVAGAAGLAVAIWFGFTARDWQRWRLAASGYVLVDTVIADSESEAEWRHTHRFAEQRPRRATAPAAADSDAGAIAP